MTDLLVRWGDDLEMGGGADTPLQIMLLSWPECFTSCFVTWCKIISKITYQNVLREAWPNTAPFFPK